MTDHIFDCVLVNAVLLCHRHKMFTTIMRSKSIALTIPTGKLAGKDIVAETDLDAALKEKVNAAAEGNHSHANKAFLDTLSGATDEEVTAMCTEVFGA